MNPETVAFWSDMAGIAATGLAAVGLLATAYSLGVNSKSNDLSSLFMVLRELSEAEGRLASSSSDPDQYRRSLNGYLNLLESLAAAVNGRLLNRVTRRIARDRLVNDLVILKSNDPGRTAFEEAITSPETFREIDRFSRKHARLIKRQAVMFSAAGWGVPVANPSGLL